MSKRFQELPIGAFFRSIPEVGGLWEKVGPDSALNWVEEDDSMRAESVGHWTPDEMVWVVDVRVEVMS